MPEQRAETTATSSSLFLEYLHCTSVQLCKRGKTQTSKCLQTHAKPAWLYCDTEVILSSINLNTTC